MSELVKSLSEIFSNRVFFVPDYQRGYAWGKKQWMDLTKDLELLPDGRKHYTGTLIIRTTNGKGTVTDEQGRVYKPFDLIDGQQRLTTCILFLKAIHTEMESFPEFSALTKGLRDMYLSNLDLNGQRFTKLTLNRDCREFFVNNILGLSPDVQGACIRAHKNLSEGRNHFEEYLVGKRAQLSAQYPSWLKHLYLKLTHDISIILYEVDNELDAGVIFETMNDRGLGLTELEKVKNYLLYVSSKLHLPGENDLAERINQTWTHVFEELMSAALSDTESEDQLLRAHWLTVYDYDQQKWKNSRSIKEKFDLEKYQGKHVELLGDLHEYLHTLRDSATAYCDLRNPERPLAFNEIHDPARRSEIIRLSSNLARLGARASFHPLLIAARLKAQDDGTTYLHAVELCARFDFRVYQWMRRQSRAGQSQLFRIGYDFFHTANPGALENSLKEQILTYCTDQEFQQRFADETVDWYDWGGLKYFLYEYEQYKAEQAGKQIRMPWQFLEASRKEDTIEHILPQNPEDNYWTERFDLDARKTWTHDIGNLTLTYDNSQLGRRPFRAPGAEKDKVRLYADSKLFIEQELKNTEHWTADEIKKRREGIRDWAVQRWHVDAPTRAAKSHGKEELPSLMRVLDLADKMGVRAEINDLLALIQQYGLHARPWRTCIMCAAPFKKNQALFTVWLNAPDHFSVGIWHETIEELYGITTATAQGNLEERLELSKGQYPGFLQRLESIFTQLTDKHPEE